MAFQDKIYGPYPEFDRPELDAALTAADAPRAIAALSKVDFMAVLFQIPCFVEEGYSTGEHAQAVFNLYCELYPDDPKEDRLKTLLHDIGKGVLHMAEDEARRRSTPEKQFTARFRTQEIYTTEIVDQLRAEGILTREECRSAYYDIRCVKFIGDAILYGTGLELPYNTARSIGWFIRNIAYANGRSAEETYHKLKSYWLADSGGGYTSRGWYISDETGERTQCLHLYDCVYDFDQPATGPLKMVPRAAERMSRLDYLAEEAAKLPSIEEEVMAEIERGDRISRGELISI